MEQRQFSVPQHLAAQCSDKILMHINRPSNFQQTIDLSFEVYDFETCSMIPILFFQDFSQGLHTDVTLITDDGVRTKIHGFLLSAASPYLCDIFNNTFSPNLEVCCLGALHSSCLMLIFCIQYSILLPDISSSVVSCLTQLLYGATVITCRYSVALLFNMASQVLLNLYDINNKNIELFI